MRQDAAASVSLRGTSRHDDSRPSIGIANIHAIVPGIVADKDKIVRNLEVFKDRGVNVAVFPLPGRKLVSAPDDDEKPSD